MSKHNPKHISGLLSQWLQKDPSGQEILTQMVQRVWTSAMGPMVANRTGRISLKNQVLTVEILSPPLRHELHQMRSEICRLLNDKLGSEAVKEIILK